MESMVTSPFSALTLGKKVILAFVVNQTVQVIKPAFLLHTGVQSGHRPLPRREMKLRTERLLLQRAGRHWQPLRGVRLHDARNIDVPPLAAGCINH